MKHTSENQGPITPEEIDDIYQKSRRKRFGDMILVLENNGFKVLALQKAMDKENMQMIAILKARGYEVIAPNDIMELEGVKSNEETEKKIEEPEQDKKEG